MPIQKTTAGRAYPRTLEAAVEAEATRDQGLIERRQILEPVVCQRAWPEGDGQAQYLGSMARGVVRHADGKTISCGHFPGHSLEGPGLVLWGKDLWFRGSFKAHALREGPPRQDRVALGIGRFERNRGSAVEGRGKPAPIAEVSDQSVNAEYPPDLVDILTLESLSSAGLANEGSTFDHETLRNRLSSAPFLSEHGSVKTLVGRNRPIEALVALHARDAGALEAEPWPWPVLDPVRPVPMLEPELGPDGVTRDRVFRDLELSAVETIGPETKPAVGDRQLERFTLARAERFAVQGPTLETLAQLAEVRSDLDLRNSGISWQSALPTLGSSSRLRVVLGDGWMFRGDLQGFGGLTLTTRIGARVPCPTVSATERAAYAGGMAEGRIEGAGRMVWEHRLEPSQPWELTLEAVGRFADGVPHGRCALRWPSGTRLSGDFDQGKLSSTAVDVSWFDGAWYRGLPHDVLGTLTAMTFACGGAADEIPLEHGLMVEGAASMLVPEGDRTVRRTGLVENGALRAAGKLEFVRHRRVLTRRMFRPHLEARREVWTYVGGIANGAPQGRGSIEGSGWKYVGEFDAGLPAQRSGECSLTWRTSSGGLQYRGTISVQNSGTREL